MSKRETLGMIGYVLLLIITCVGVVGYINKLAVDWNNKADLEYDKNQAVKEGKAEWYWGEVGHRHWRLLKEEE